MNERGRHFETCPSCSGGGRGADGKACGKCEGTGHIEVDSPRHDRSSRVGKTSKDR